MTDFAPDLQAIYSQYEPEIDRLKRMLWNMYSVSNIRYVYSYLRSLEPEITHEFIMLSEALTTSLVIGYGRLFTETNGTSKLNARLVPEHLRPIHDEIMSLRHERYAHHGVHESLETQVDIQSAHDCLVVMPELNLKICLGAPKEWGPLFQWIDELMYEQSKKQLDYLSKVSGMKWTMPHGPSPSWLSDQSTSTQP